MNVTEIPFNKFIEISDSNPENPGLELSFADTRKNHLGTFHAGALFALAEACSGKILQQEFPHLADKVVPLLRKSEVKFKRPAESDIRAEAVIDEEAKINFSTRFEKKGRATITVAVNILDQNNTIAMTGSFEWFIQSL